MSCCYRFALFFCTSVGLWGCKEDPAPAEKPSEPWPAPAVSSAAAPASLLVKYELSSRQRVDFELKTKTTKIVGFFPVVRGNLELDLMHLDKSKATIEVDLGAVRIEAEDERDHRSQSLTAMNWLNVGSSIPESTRAGRRWAKFEIAEVFEISAEAAHEGRIERHSQETSEQENDAGVDAPLGEVRRVVSKARGPLSVNERRMSEDLNVSVSFSYPDEATPGFPPDTVLVRSSRALQVPLEAFGIEPRNAAGVAVASDMKLLGSTVGRIAFVSFALTFRHQSAKP